MGCTTSQQPSLPTTTTLAGEDAEEPSEGESSEEKEPVRGPGVRLVGHVGAQLDFMGYYYRDMRLELRAASPSRRTSNGSAIASGLAFAQEGKLAVAGDRARIYTHLQYSERHMFRASSNGGWFAGSSGALASGMGGGIGSCTPGESPVGLPFKFHCAVGKAWQYDHALQCLAVSEANMQSEQRRLHALKVAARKIHRVRVVGITRMGLEGAYTMDKTLSASGVHGSRVYAKDGSKHSDTHPFIYMVGGGHWTIGPLASCARAGLRGATHSENGWVRSTRAAFSPCDTGADELVSPASALVSPATGASLDESRRLAWRWSHSGQRPLPPDFAVVVVESHSNSESVVDEDEKEMTKTSFRRVGGKRHKRLAQRFGSFLRAASAKMTSGGSLFDLSFSDDDDEEGGIDDSDESFTTGSDTITDSESDDEEIRADRAFIDDLGMNAADLRREQRERDFYFSQRRRERKKKRQIIAEERFAKQSLSIVQLKAERDERENHRLVIVEKDKSERSARLLCSMLPSLGEDDKVEDSEADRVATTEERHNVLITVVAPLRTSSLPPLAEEGGAVLRKLAEEESASSLTTVAADFEREAVKEENDKNLAKDVLAQRRARRKSMVEQSSRLAKEARQLQIDAELTEVKMKLASRAKLVSRLERRSGRSATAAVRAEENKRSLSSVMSVSVVK